jgi:serine/threonine protein kinase/Tfp pilus assembly protein PilF
MNPINLRGPGSPGAADEAAPDDPRVVRALQEYMAAVEAGQRPDRREFQARYADVAQTLAECLDGLEFVRSAVPHLYTPPGTPRPAGTLPEIQPSLTLGDFRIVREIGRGGMGVVYEAEQISLGRRVALKVLPFAATFDPKHLQRFQNEAQAAARLQHPHIVPVFAVGCERGVHFYAMQFIEGQTLAALIRQLGRAAEAGPGDSTEEQGPPAGGPVPDPSAAALDLVTQAAADPSRPFYRTVARLGVQAAEALEHAHQMGLLHRDVKPANLLVDLRGHLWITDFGLARVRDEAGPTLTGDLVGTLRYMSPEQAFGRRSQIDPRTDVYSLGATLYELLTLRPAFPGRDRQELLREIAFNEPRRPRRVKPDVPADLELIVLKAMAKDPAGRYVTAQELADDLQRFLNDKPIRARPPSPWQLLAKWSRRHRTALAAAAGLLVLSVVALAFSTYQIWQEKERTADALRQVRIQWNMAQSKGAEAQRQRERAEQNFRRARDAVTEMLQQLDEKKWERVPQIRELRQALAGNLLRKFKPFLDESSCDPDVRLQSALAHMLVGHVYRMQEDMAQAVAAHRKAVELLTQLEGEDPGNAIYHQELALSYHTLGQELQGMGRATEATAAFRQAVTHYEKAVEDPQLARAYNNYAWFLITCPQCQFRDAARAITLAEHALVIFPCPTAPWCSSCWNTLGVARYRLGDWRGAIEALEKSCTLNSGGEPIDWFFLAMAHWQLGEKAKARSYYDRGVQGNSTCTEPVSPYQAEAAALLGVPCEAVGSRTGEPRPSGRGEGKTPP